MVGFVIPFKSKAKSKNWQKDCLLLKRTLESVLNQTDTNFRCYVVYTNLPELRPEDEKVTWLQFPFSFLESHQIADEEKYKGWTHLPFFFDQGRKALYGAMAGKMDGCNYIMMLDADDLLACKLTEYVNSQEKEKNCGFYVEKGYLYTEKCSLMIKVPRQMNAICGSVNIIRADVIPNIDFSVETYENYSFFSAHAYMKTRIQYINGQIIKPLPFYSLIYVIHTNNQVASKKILTGTGLRSLAKKIVRGKLVTSRLRKEFGLFDLPT